MGGKPTTVGCGLPHALNFAWPSRGMEQVRQIHADSARSATGGMAEVFPPPANDPWRQGLNKTLVIKKIHHTAYAREPAVRHDCSSTRAKIALGLKPPEHSSRCSTSAPGRRHVLSSRWEHVEGHRSAAPCFRRAARARRRLPYGACRRTIVQQVRQGPRLTAHRKADEFGPARSGIVPSRHPSPQTTCSCRGTAA